VAGDSLFPGWLLIRFLLHPVRVMTLSMVTMAMISSMVREEMIVSILCMARMTIFERLISRRELSFQTFLAEEGRTVRIIPHQPICAVTFSMAPNTMRLYPSQQKFTESSVQILWMVTAEMT
jgi:hypothetical protein